MRISRRIVKVIAGLLMILAGGFIVLSPGDGYYLILYILSFGLSIAGIKSIIYYITMARFMIGGKIALYKGVILMDFGFLAISLIYVPRVYFLAYLVILHSFYGLIDLLRARESKRMGTENWMLLLVQGIVNLLVSITAVVFIKIGDIAVVIYGASIVLSGINNIFGSIKKTAFVYIQ